MKKLYLISLGLLLTMLVALLLVIRVLDYSVQTPYDLSSAQKQTDFYLVSYADGRKVFYQNRNMLVDSAVNKGFDFIFNYRREHIDPEYIVQHPILNEKVGAGYWLWKPYLILKALNSMPEGSILTYADSGMFFRQPIREYFSKGLADRDILLFKYNNDGSGNYAENCATEDTFNALNCNADYCRRGPHVWAGILVLRNSASTRAFIAEWLKYCEQTDLLIGKTTAVNSPAFEHHQHDEAILSVLVAREASLVSTIKIDRNFAKYIKQHRRKQADKTILPYVITGKILHRREN